MSGKAMRCLSRIDVLGVTALGIIATCPPSRAQPGTIPPPGLVTKVNATIRWNNEPKPGWLPRGMRHATYHSKYVNADVGYCIYLPPSYVAEESRRYPVVYVLHPAGGDELFGDRVARILEEGILAGRWPAMILVVPNGGKLTFFNDSADGRFPVESMLVRELIPHIDATYRTIAAKEGRAIEGFSMGGRGAMQIAVKYPDLFCSVSDIAGNLLHLSDLYDPNKPKQYPAEYLGTEKQPYVDNDPYLLLQKNVDAIKKGLHIQMICGTGDANHLPSIRDYHAALLKANVDHTYIEFEGIDHEDLALERRLRLVWFDHHVRAFADAAKQAGGARK
jgi:endo-1,4-beta-xylanase